MSDSKLYIGLDVGSTTVKAVVMDAGNNIVWKDYRRHNAKPPETVVDFLTEIGEYWKEYWGHCLY